MAELRQLSETSTDFPPVLFVHTGQGAAGNRFLERAWPEARAISDQSAELYEAFSIGRGGPIALFGPTVWQRGWSAWWAGHRIGAPSGDPLRMSGMFAVVDREPRWAHVSKHAGDHPDFGTLTEQLRGAAETPANTSASPTSTRSE